MYVNELCLEHGLKLEPKMNIIDTELVTSVMADGYYTTAVCYTYKMCNREWSLANHAQRNPEKVVPVPGIAIPTLSASYFQP